MFPIVEAGAATADMALPAFLVAGDGLLLRKRTLLGVSQTRVQRIAGLAAGTEFVEYALPPVPVDVMARVVGFFRAVYAAHRTEAAVLLVWREGVFDVVVPPQEVTAVSVAFDVRDGDVPAGWRVVGSMHSHGAYGAYASTTDEDDEAELDGLHVVVGDFARRSPGYAAAVVVDGVRFELELGRLLERPRRLVEPPADWLARVTVAQVRRPTRTSTAAGLLGTRIRPTAEPASPTRRDLDVAIERAAAIAASLGYRLRHRLQSAWATSSGAGREGNEDA